MTIVIATTYARLHVKSRLVVKKNVVVEFVVLVVWTGIVERHAFIRVQPRLVITVHVIVMVVLKRVQEQICSLLFANKKKIKYKIYIHLRRKVQYNNFSLHETPQAFLFPFFYKPKIDNTEINSIKKKK